MSDSVSSSPSYNKPLTCCCNRIEEVQCDITYIEADPDNPGYGRYASQTITLTKYRECECARCYWYAEIGVDVWIWIDASGGGEWIIVTTPLYAQLSCHSFNNGSYWSFLYWDGYGGFGHPECDTNSLGPVTHGSVTMFFYW